MTTGSTISSVVTAAIVIGFLAFSVGVGLWTWQELDQFGASFVVRLVVAGFLILILGILASKLFSRVE